MTSLHNHPWRKGRTSRYAAYLDTLPAEERKRVEAAERAYVCRATRITSPRVAVARDFNESMQGVLTGQ
jgi:hypothetical protein